MSQTKNAIVMQRLTKMVDAEVAAKAKIIAGSDDFIAMKEKHRAYLDSLGLLDRYFEQRMEEMAKDIAERQEERAVDMLQFERAGLSKSDQKLIPKLDETNNSSYKYMRDHGNNWQYDPAKVDPRMKVRLYRRFDTFDKDSDYIMMLDEVLYWADRMKTVCKASDKQIESVRKELRAYFTAYGLGGDGLNRENWVEAHCTMGASVKERRKHGDPIPMEQLANAYFEVLDADDDGVLTLPELKKMMNVFRVPEEAAFPYFQAADQNGNGLLERTEMHKLFYSFWFDACDENAYDPSVDGIFAHKY